MMMDILKIFLKIKYISSLTISTKQQISDISKSVLTMTEIGRLECSQKDEPIT